MEFDIPKERPSIIKVIGVGGGGSNAVNHMYLQGIRGVDFLVCNTDAQALEISPVPMKIQLGCSLTEGRGAGSLPEIGKNSAIENLEEIKASLGSNTKMVFVTAGMGGGTGTGAAPIIAGVAKEMGILTVGIVTVPFSFEGKKRKSQAELGIDELKNNVDTLLVISNDKLRLIHGDLKLTDAFGKADDILTIAAKSIAEIITVTGYINVDFADVQTVLKESGVAIMGRATYEGENRAIKAAELALESPLLNDNNISGARYVLLSIISGNNEVTMDEIGEITDYIQEQAGDDADIIFGTGKDESLGNKVCITVIATGFDANAKVDNNSVAEFKVINLEEPQAKTVAEPTEPEPHVDYSGDEQLEPYMKTDFESEAYEYETISKAIIPPIEEKPEHQFTIKTIEPEKVPESEVIEWNVTESSINISTEETFNVESESSTSLSFADETLDVHEQITTVELEAKPEITEEKAQTEIVMEATEDDIFKKTKERIEKLRQISYANKARLEKDPHAIYDLEKEPAYMRLNVELDNVPHSNENQMSRLVLYEDADKKVEVRESNSFFKDQVD